MPQTQTPSPEQIPSNEPSERYPDRAQTILEDKKLIAAMLSGDKQAGQEFYEKYHRLAKMFANRALSVQDDKGTLVSRDDYDQEILELILQLAHKYNQTDEPTVPFIGYLNSTFLIPQLKNRMFNARHNVTLPSDIATKVRKMDAINNHRRLHERPLMTDEEAAEELDIRVHAVDGIKQAAFIAKHMGSLDKGFSPGRDDDRGNEYVVDERVTKDSLTTASESLDDAVETTDIKRLAERYLDQLPEDERKILELYWGFHHDKPIEYDPESGGFTTPSPFYTFKEIGKIVGLSDARVQHIMSRSIASIRHMAAKENRARETRFAQDPQNFATKDTRYRKDGIVKIERTSELIPELKNRPDEYDSK